MSGRVLGLVLAGGRSRRFGSDKALAELGGRTLLDHASTQMRQWCDEIVIAGREGGLADWPQPGMGPLAGLAAGLRHARENEFESVLSCGVDSLELPEDLGNILCPAPAFLASQPVVGHWPASASDTIEATLTGEGRHSMLAFAKAIHAREVQLEAKPANINTPDDLAEAEKRHGL